MQITTIKTRIFLPPKDDLFSLLQESFLQVPPQEESVIVITSKIVAIWQQRCVLVSSVKDKDELIKQEADFYIDRNKVPRQYVILTLKDNLLIPTSGIDESNANGYYILWPDRPFLAAKKLHQFIIKTYGLKRVGIIISDSRSNFLRFGVTGIAIGFYGFKPLKDYRGSKDIFGRTLKLSQTNMVDSLAAAAVCQMGEGAEKTPIAIIENIKHITFCDTDFNKHNPLSVDKKNDIYAPLLCSPLWKKGGFVKM